MTTGSAMDPSARISSPVDLDGPTSDIVTRARDRATAHPLLVVLGLSMFGALASAVWIWRHRQLGAYDPDEAGYLATALRYQREPGLSPLDLIRQIGETSHGPLVPLLSRPFLMVGPRDPRTAMMVQPALLVLTSVSVAGIVRRLAGPAAAILAGCSVVALPTVLDASHSYWYGLGAAAFTTASVWALLSSEGLTNRNRWLYGLCMGLAPLARTMALGFVPALMIAGIALAWPDRRRLVGLVQSWLLALGVAAPWWIARRHEIFDYLTSYGYGERAGLWGSGGPLARLGFRLVRVAEGLSFVTPIVLLGAVCAVATTAILRRRGGGRPEGWRAMLAVVWLCAGMLAALVSTTNQGVWFELPLIVVVAALGVALSFVPHSPRVPLAALMGVMIVLLPARAFLSGAGHVDAAFARHDARFGSSHTEDEAAREWAALTDQVQRELAAVTSQGTTAAVYLTGNMFLFNSNSIALSAELDGWAARIRVPDTLATSDHSEVLTPTLVDEHRPDGKPKERILVVTRHDFQLFTPDANWRSLDQQAMREGWVEDSILEMPVGGEVAILRHPSNEIEGE